MVKLQVNAAPQLGVVQSTSDLTLEEEITEMVINLREMQDATPDLIITTCMGYMARCTEIHLQLIRVEGTNRKLKTFRVTQLAKVMELIEFEFRGASRLIEVRRQEVELSR